MEIQEVMKNLREDYQKEKTEGCMNRAVILYCFMKDGGLNPIIINFSFLTREEKKVTHYIVIENEQVYDCNKCINPFDWKEYKGGKETKHKTLCWNKYKEDIWLNHTFENLINYLGRRFDKDFQDYIMPSLEKYGGILFKRQKSSFPDRKP